LKIHSVPALKSVKWGTMKSGGLKAALSALAFCCFLNVSAQKVDLLTLDQLYERVKRGSDTIFVVNFWATWCVPCVQELPNFEKLSIEHVNEKLKVLLISVDFKSQLKSAVIPFVKKNGIRNEVFLLNEPDPQVYINRIDSSWSGAIPATAILKDQKHVFFEKEFTYEELLTVYKKME
jgi:thiol-disulfide isomerase/thioredoxin